MTTTDEFTLHPRVQEGGAMTISEMYLDSCAASQMEKDFLHLKSGHIIYTLTYCVALTWAEKGNTVLGGAIIVSKVS